MISHACRAIYIHQRKCAGTSIIHSFDIRPEMPDWHTYNNGVLEPDWASRPPYFVFSSVRNPFDRLVSSWKYLESTRHRALEEVLAAPPADGHDYRHFTRPQADILCEPATGRLVVDDLVRFETLQADYDRICARIGKPFLQLPRVNVTERDRAWRPYFTTEARRLAETMFARDLALFDYDF